MNKIVLENIDKQFGARKIFRNLNMQIDENEFVCIVGESGSGKSTLLNIMGLLEKPTSGNVEICGIKNPKLNSRIGVQLLRKEISYLFQNYGLVESETVKYNVKIVTRFLNTSKKKREEKTEEILEKLGLLGLINEKIYCLSGGEQQRVALAKIMIKPSSIILADEPTGSLDVGNRDLVMKILKEINLQGKTIVLVTHDKEITKYATRIIEITK
ncbi:MAG: ATP-binding cassette domain-containing protein [Lachnospiraceae bacterium]|jgi:putative ABC transport system ATP-binding protein|nr:ATP-binding cassette domain-containing protein [Lachnospiraceae bacterium]